MGCARKHGNKGSYFNFYFYFYVVLGFWNFLDAKGREKERETEAILNIFTYSQFYIQNFVVFIKEIQNFFFFPKIIEVGVLLIHKESTTYI